MHGGAAGFYGGVVFHRPMLPGFGGRFCALSNRRRTFAVAQSLPMDLIVWLLVGCAVGWASYAFLRFNEKRGVHVSIALGAMGALLGGTLVAPILTFLALAPRDFSRPGLLFAAAVAATVLALGNLVYARWGV